MTTDCVRYRGLRKIPSGEWFKEFPRLQHQASRSPALESGFNVQYSMLEHYLQARILMSTTPSS